MMKKDKSLLEALGETKYQLNGHGKRNIKVLTDVLDEVDEAQESDIYGTGKVIKDFEDKMAEYLGKKFAVFFPSGTMAQQIALRIWSDRNNSKKVAYHPLCHLEIHEEDGLKELHQLEPILLANKDRLITFEDVTNLDDRISCLLLELPQREIGGQLPDYETLEAINSYCKTRKIRLHLDGARLFETLPYYKKSAAEICHHFDSVYVSFYKGLGGIAGAILASDDEEFVKEAKVWKRRHGGDLISLYPYILSADYYFDKRIDMMGHYYEQAKELAEYFNKCHLTRTNPYTPVTNMFHVHFSASKDKIEPILIALYEETGIGLTGSLKEVNDTSCYFELSIGDRYNNITKKQINEFFILLEKKLKKL